MPETIGNHGLYCPDFDDYAAVALYMQDLGTRIDTALQGQLDELNGFLVPPAILLTNSAAVTITAADPIDTTIFDTVLVNTSTFMSYDVTAGQLLIGSAAGAAVTIPYERGAYSVGGGIRISAVGAVTVGSSRTFQAQVVDTTQVPVFPAAEFVITSPFDSTSDQNTGGNYGLNIKTNFLLSGTSGVRITHFVTHGNAASDVSIPAGAALLWVLFNGANDIIEVL